MHTLGVGAVPYNAGMWNGLPIQGLRPYSAGLDGFPRVSGRLSRSTSWFQFAVVWDPKRSPVAEPPKRPSPSRPNPPISE